MEHIPFHVITLGCDKNSVDSEGMSQLLLEQGYSPAGNIENARVIIVNTCGFIDLARRESLHCLRAAASSKRKGQILIAAGCLAERDGESLKKEVAAIDGVIGTRNLGDIGLLLKDMGMPTSSLPTPELEDGACDGWLTMQRRSTSATAFVKIADGCNGSCRFCAIPQIKGPYRSKPAGRVVDEVRQLVGQGVQEVVLIAQDTTAYGHDLPEKTKLSTLIDRILDAVPQVPWLRLLYTYPQRIDDDLLETMAGNPQVCHYLDLPLQHGDAHVLERMGRPSDVAAAKEIIRKARHLMPDVALRTTFIVGYPGETEGEFRNLLDLMRDVAFDHVGAFAYSREKGTKAAGMPGQVADRIKKRRLRQVMEMQQLISLQKNRAMVGQTIDVLIEGAGEIEDESTATREPVAVGRARRHAPEVDGMVFVSGCTATSGFVPVEIKMATDYDLWGEAA